MAAEAEAEDFKDVNLTSFFIILTLFIDFYLVFWYNVYEVFMKITVNNVTINVIVNYKNIKNIYFRFDEKNNLVISAPLKMKEAEVKASIHKNESDIYNLYIKQKQKNVYNEKFYYLGKEYNVNYIETLNKVGFKDDTVYAPSEEALEKFWQHECEKVFTGETKICKKCFASLPDFKIKIRKMKTRWGVCNTRKKEITLNSELLKKNLEIIDYVIIHELCHFFEPNHSKNFWTLVEAACPKYKILRGELKKW